MERRMRACPAVSVIIPMYNAEKYVADCLDSLLEQTFTDFEAIVVDDCSTDTGAAIVESYIPKFDGRLKLSRTEKNSGSAAVPRNEGLMLSRGKYAYFMDSDDMLTNDALEQLYSTMESADVDLVFCTRNYFINESGSEIKEFRIPVDRFEEKTVLYEDLTKRVQDIVQWKFSREVCRSFCRRDFLVENKIFFPHVHGEDAVWFYALFFYAKKILFLTEPIYLYRILENSVLHAKRPPKQYVNYWLNPVIIGLKTLEQHFNKIEFFRQNPQYKYVVLEVFVQGYFDRIFESSCQLPPFEIYEAIKQEFGDRLGEQDALVAALCTIINDQHKALSINQQQFKRLAEKSQRELQASRQQFKELAAQVQQVIDDLEARLK